MDKIFTRLIYLAVLFFSFASSGQQPTSSSPSLSTPAIRVTTHLVLLDVVATDNSGKTVRNLKPEEFKLEENGKRQKLIDVSFRDGSLIQPSDLQLGPNLYSNRPDLNAPNGPLTIVLIDALNTLVQNQSYARQQLLRWVDTQLKPGQRVAVYALGNQVFKLSGFTSDPAVLKDAIASFKTIELSVQSMSTPPVHQMSAVPDLAIGTRNSEAHANIALRQASLALQAFDGEVLNRGLEIRIAETLEAIRLISLSVAGYPGRKNLVWVTAGFPFSLLPQNQSLTSGLELRAVDPTAPPPLPSDTANASAENSLREKFNTQFMRMQTVLTDAEISIYPVDARGLIGAAGADAATGGVKTDTEYGQSVRSFSEGIIDSQEAMRDLANETGGKLFSNRNDIDAAVALASEDGATYYTLAYYPEKLKLDGGFRKFKVEVSRPGVKLRCRPGYFAIDPYKASPRDRDIELASTIRGAVDSSMIVFDAQVTPPQPGKAAPVPIKFLVHPETVTTEEMKDGNRKLSLDFLVTAFSSDGKVALNTAQTVNTSLKPEQYQFVLKQGLLMPMDVQLKPGEYRLRLTVRDNRTGYVGTISLPLKVQS